MRKPLVIAALVAAAATGFVLAPAGVALSEDVASVVITNWPKVWNVTGVVGIDGPLIHSKFVALREVTIPPINPKDTARMLQGGIVTTDGFTAMVLGLQGQIKGEIYRPGTVGVFLLPDEEAVVKVFDEKGMMPFATEINVPGVSAASPYFASNSTSVQVAFPRYRTYFYNMSDKTVTVNLYAYLTN